ncbi:DNA polymerase III subunit beta [Candidatus Mycoplasma haematobovis]|uniref:DNA polymerase III subunit beta n=1 Tax=Candidatus Mycoplasma haematobovis TaxID=432608 RepID=A0A1A9QE85_9MOLU|nr:DNA polymerase III subunit beta [Candidatus Mycoplasma haematobovis]OAL10275.1 DNA polymerase III subunit beta [Candidatus Mycoplasma haematobovis]
MHLIFKNDYIKSIKNFISIPYESFEEKIKNIEINCNSEEVILIISNSKNLFKLNLNKGENLNIYKTGNFLLEIKLLNSLIDNLKSDNILEIFKVEDNYLQFLSGNFECNLISKKINNKNNNLINFNLIENKKINISYSLFNISYSKLKNFCKGQDNTFHNNDILKNIHFKKKLDENLIEVWSSDNYRTVFGKFEYEKNIKFELNIRPLLLNTLLTLFSNYLKEDLDIWITNNEFICRKDNLFMKVNVDADNFPEFSNWFKSKPNIEFILSKTELLEAIDRNLLLIVNKNLKTTIYKLDGDKLWIEYDDLEKGFCKEFIFVKNLSDNNIEFSINNTLLKPLIKNIDSERILFSIFDSFKPILILPYKNEKDNFKQFILPIRNV